MFKTLVEFHTSAPSTYGSDGEGPDEGGGGGEHENKMVIMFQFLNNCFVCVHRTAIWGASCGNLYVFWFPFFCVAACQSRAIQTP